MANVKKSGQKLKIVQSHNYRTPFSQDDKVLWNWEWGATVILNDQIQWLMKDWTSQLRCRQTVQSTASHEFDHEKGMPTNQAKDNYLYHAEKQLDN